MLAHLKTWPVLNTLLLPTTTVHAYDVADAVKIKRQGYVRRSIFLHISLAHALLPVTQNTPICQAAELCS